MKVHRELEVSPRSAKTGKSSPVQVTLVQLVPPTKGAAKAISLHLQFQAFVDHKPRHSLSVPGLIAFPSLPGEDMLWQDAKTRSLALVEATTVSSIDPRDASTISNL